MKKQQVITLALLLTALLIGVAVALVTIDYLHPNTAIGESVVLARYYDGVLTSNNTAINWGIVQPSTTYTKLLNVTNSGSITAEVTLLYSGLPSGWSYSWGANNTVIALGEWANGTLTLTTTTVVDGEAYVWTSIVRGAQT